MSPRKSTVKAQPANRATKQVPKLPVHDIKGVVVFPMSRELRALLGEESFEATCGDLGSRDFALVFRSPERIVYVQLSPIVVPMDVVLSPTPPKSAALATATRKGARKPSATTS